MLELRCAIWADVDRQSIMIACRAAPFTQKNWWVSFEAEKFVHLGTKVRFTSAIIEDE